VNRWLVAREISSRSSNDLLSRERSESASNIALSPVFAVAAVLLTVDLIAARDGAGPHLNVAPSTATA